MSIKDTFLSSFGRIEYVAKQKKPELMLIGGFAAIVAGVASMWSVKEKTNDILDKHDDAIERLHENRYSDPGLSDKEYNKEVTKTYVHTGLRLTKAFAPTVTLVGSGMLLIFSSHNELKKRNVALIAAYNTLDTAFRTYRERVISELGEDNDRHFRYGTEKIVDNETIVDENGKKKKVKKETEIYTDISDFSRIFDKTHSEFHREEYEGPYAMTANYMWLRGVEAAMNRRLQIHHQVTLNEVYEALRLPKSYAGSFVGWRDVEHGGKSGYISFNIKDEKESLVHFTENDANNYGILLEFNVDGVILDSKFDEISGTEAFKL